VGEEQYLRAQGAVELIFVVVLLAWFIPRKYVFAVASLIFVEMLSILILVGIKGDTFRDIGLVGAALALMVLLKKKSSPQTIHESR
ncbi:MAG TPA: hypothetical protein VI981_03715, partial [Candidatus Paceibacterota bacterium]